MRLGNPSATTTAGRASLSWSPATDASGIAYYRVHRSTSSGFAPDGSNEIAQTTLTGYTDSGNGASNGLPAGTYFYKLVAVDSPGNAGPASGQGAGTVSADTALPRVLFGAPTPASLSTVSGTVTLSAEATPVSASSTVGYGFDAAGFRRSRTLDGTTTRYLLGGLIETTTTGVITGFDVDGPAGDLAHYTSAPTTAINPTYSYYSGHGDLAAEANHTGARTRLLKLDPWGKPITAPGGSDMQELHTGRWDKKHDLTTSLIEMGARPYEPAIGRFLAVDPVDGGSLNNYEYAGQDPVNDLDLTGAWCKRCKKYTKKAVSWTAGKATEYGAALFLGTKEVARKTVPFMRGGAVTVATYVRKLSPAATIGAGALGGAVAQAVADAFESMPLSARFGRITVALAITATSVGIGVVATAACGGNALCGVIAAGVANKFLHDHAGSYINRRMGWQP